MKSKSNNGTGLAPVPSREDGGFLETVISAGILNIPDHIMACERCFAGTHAAPNLVYSRANFKRKENRDANRSDIWHASTAGSAEVAKGLQPVADIGLETDMVLLAGVAFRF